MSEGDKVQLKKGGTMDSHQTVWGENPIEGDKYEHNDQRWEGPSQLRIGRWWNKGRNKKAPKISLETIVPITNRLEWAAGDDDLCSIRAICSKAKRVGGIGNDGGL